MLNKVCKEKIDKTVEKVIENWHNQNDNNSNIS